MLSGKDYNLLNSYHLVHLRFTVGLLYFNNILFRFSVLSEKYNMKLDLLLVREDLHIPFPDVNSRGLSAWKKSQHNLLIKKAPLLTNDLPSS